MFYVHTHSQVDVAIFVTYEQINVIIIVKLLFVYCIRLSCIL